MSKLDKLKEKARSLEAKDPKGAIEAWLEAIKEQDQEEEANADLSIYNRIGDLYLKLKDPGQAADYYEHAVDKYAELGFHNNAIALCNKVLRNAPTRQGTYLKLAKLYASKGFLGEAKQNFMEYAARMQKAGKIQQAFRALKELTALSPDSAGLRAMLEEHLKMYGAPDRHSAGSMPAPEPEDLSKSGKHKTSSLVFLDLDEPPVAKDKKRGPPARPTAPQPPPIERNPTLLTEVVAEPDTSLEIETTSLAGEEGDATSGGVIDGLERTIDFGEMEATAPSLPSIRDELPSDDIEALDGLEPTMEVEPTEPVEDVPEPEPPPRRAPHVTIPKFGARKPAVTPVVPKRPSAPAAPQEPTPKVRPVIPQRPAAPPPAAPSKKRQASVQVPPLELEPDFETETTARSHEVDDEPLAVELGVDGIVNSDMGGALMFASIEEAPAAATIEELEERVADDPDDPDAHRALGEALIEAAQRERGIEELDHATAGLENRGDLEQAQSLVGEILRLDPNSVRHRQKQVEYAFKAGDKASLIDAYLELADTLLRSDLPEKARAVYQRVAEHDASNERAKGALAMLAPVTSPAPAPAPGRKAPQKKDERVAPKDAKMKVRDEADEGGEFVDLGAFILEEDVPARDTRMKVADEEPTGDEEKDFRDMLARFRQGIDENIEETDFQSHYDLGVAFKEMGLLDEAIAEFQRALPAPEGKLKTSEALGTCFFEKKAFVVAESVLRRALEFPAASEQERLGVCYWLGRALEAQGKRPEARELYGRVFEVDIRFADVGARVKALAKAK